MSNRAVESYLSSPRFLNLPYNSTKKVTSLHLVLTVTFTPELWSYRTNFRFPFLWKLEKTWFHCNWRQGIASFVFSRSSNSHKPFWYGRRENPRNDARLKNKGTFQRPIYVRGYACHVMSTNGKYVFSSARVLQSHSFFLKKKVKGVGMVKVECHFLVKN